MTEPIDAGQPAERVVPERFRQLPPRVRLEDTVAGQDPDPPPDPQMGQDTERDFMLRYSE